ncbi:hypothetical protein V9T40_008367 [Parthenolecanium corni]|uniref:Uncharacterized protein n=1 Tax=Parthenolecanium corni TaxID=536013 RepID=A0AAN9TMZ2_9HEMI
MDVATFQRVAISDHIDKNYVHADARLALATRIENGRVGVERNGVSKATRYFSTSSRAVPVIRLKYDTRRVAAPVPGTALCNLHGYLVDYSQPQAYAYTAVRTSDTAVRTTDTAVRYAIPLEPSKFQRKSLHPIIGKFNTRIK